MSSPGGLGGEGGLGDAGNGDVPVPVAVHNLTSLTVTAIGTGPAANHAFAIGERTSSSAGARRAIAYYLGMHLPARHVGRLPLIAIVLAALLTSIVCGCGGKSHGSSAVGPLSSGNGIHASPARGFGICAPGGRPSAFGFDQFTNYGQSAVILSRVVLLHPRNERLVGAVVIAGDRILGAVRWPPSSRPAWQDRQPVHGFRLAAGKSFNMVLGIAAIVDDRRATSQGELVYYHDSSGRYAAKSYSTYTIAAVNKSCS